MMFFAHKVRDTPSLMQMFMANPEWFMFRCASISTTAFVFTRWIVIEFINSVAEVRRRKSEAGNRRGHRVGRK